jgi:hypothetical protein
MLAKEKEKKVALMADSGEARNVGGGMFGPRGVNGSVVI